MQVTRLSLAAGAAFGLAAAWPALAQEAPAAPAAPAEAPAAPATAPAAPAADAPAQPAITVVEHGDWEVGCLEGTQNCEMQQVAEDGEGNPVVLVRLVKLPADAEAEALAVFNTPLGTLLPPGMSFQVDAGETAALPFEWCVQEGCIVRLGLRDADVAALKRGKAVTLQVASIAAPEAPISLTLSLTGFTAAFDSLPVPVLDGPAQP